MNEEDEFRQQCQNEVYRQGHDGHFLSLTNEWMSESIRHRYSYHFEWLGRPIIQYPQDIVGMQQLLWSVKPNLVIETGIARGGSLVYYASILELIAQCGGPIDARVLGIDIHIRPHNREAIFAHPMSKRIEIIQGSSIESSTLSQVKERAKAARTVLICLDSNHTHDHVLQELRLYAPLCSLGSYVVVFDTVIEDLPSDSVHERSWGKGNNPKTAVSEYLREVKSEGLRAADGAILSLEVDRDIESRLLISVAQSGFLRRC